MNSGKTISEEDNPMPDFLAVDPKPATGTAAWTNASRRRPNTRAMQAEEAERLHALLESIPLAAVSADADGTIRDLNAGAERLLGLRRYQAAGKSLYDFHGPDTIARIRAMFDDFASGERQSPVVVERELNGRWVQMRFTPLFDRDGRLQGVNATFADETEKKQLRERIRALESDLVQEQKLSAIGMMASGLAHNLNGPLAVIVGYLDLLYARQSHLGEIPLILAQAERMKDIISTMMMKSRHDQDRQKRTLDLNQLLQNELKFLEANLQFKNQITKQFEFARGLPPVYGLYSDFSQVFLNLVNNAVDAMVDAPVKTLRVSTRCDEDNLYVEVADTGCGLDPAEAEKLFTPFYSTKPPVGENASGRPSGTGLGLSSARQLVEQYGGRIQVEGRPGVGASFTVVIPLAANRLPAETGGSRMHRDQLAETLA